MIFTNRIKELANKPLNSLETGIILQRENVNKVPQTVKTTGNILPFNLGSFSRQSVLDKLQNIDDIQEVSTALFFWYFDNSFFKSALGIDGNGHVFPGLLEQNLEKGDFILDTRNILITHNFAEAHTLGIDDSIVFGKYRFVISGILRPSPSGNIIHTDIYMDIESAREIVINSVETRSLYNIESKNISNVVTLRTDPRWKGDKDREVKALDRDYLVFSEKTFSHDIENQIALISSFGKFICVIPGIIILILFGLLVFFNFKTREREVAVLRIIGWPMNRLKGQFIAENLILLCIGLVLGNLFEAACLFFIGMQSVSMELPWDISANPHFLPQENAINRTITTLIPVHFDWSIFLVLTFAFLFIFGTVIFLLFSGIKNIKPLKYLVH